MGKLKVDQETCIGCALCSELCGEIFKINDGEAKMQIKRQPNGNECESEIKEAIDMCPVGAISN
jgi:ferredoxin